MPAKRKATNAGIDTTRSEGLFGTSYDYEVDRQRPNYDAAPFDKWPHGAQYVPFIDSGLQYDPEELPFHVNEMPQIRTSYDPEKIEDLAARVRTVDGREPFIELEQAIRIAEFTNEGALKVFLDDFQLFHALPEPITVTDFDPEPNGAIRILDYGHRRIRAIKLVAKGFHYTVLNKDVKKELMTNPTFERFIDAQSRENEHDRPGPEDEAADVRKRFNYYTAKNNNVPPTKAWLARKMGLSEDKVRSALRFTDLSPQIMQWFNEGIINYAVAVECWRLREAALSYYPQKYPHKYEVGSGLAAADAEALVLAELAKFASDHMKGASYDRKLSVIQAKIKSLDLSQLQDALFDDAEWDNPQHQKQVGGRNMAGYALRVLGYRMSDPDVSNAELVALEELYERSRELLRARAEVNAATS